jgi:hypothetical protein
MEGGRVKEKFNYETVHMKIMWLYFELTVDPKATAARDNVLGNWWHALKPFWKGKKPKTQEEYDLTKDYDALITRREAADMTEWKELNKIDMERVGLCMDAFGWGGLLPKVIPSLRMGRPPDSERAIGEHED